MPDERYKEEPILLADPVEEPPRDMAPPMVKSTLLSSARGSAGSRGAEPVAVQSRELLAIAAMVVISDIAIYRGGGFAGYAMWFLAAPAVLLLGSTRTRERGGLLVVALMLVLLAGKLVWSGSVMLVLCGLGLVVAFAMALSGLRPFVLEGAVFGSQTIHAGYEGLRQFGRAAKVFAPGITRIAWLNLLLPLGTVIVFGWLFVMANPQLLSAFGEGFEWFFTSLVDWSPSPLEVIFWGVVLWLTIGLLRPLVDQTLTEEAPPTPAATKAEQAEAPVYGAFRNTLLTVIGLFAVYLIFEFATLWFRDFPDGFHYSGYAHEGAAWLTVALALATVLLSGIFRDAMLRDPRTPQLRRLAWLWSAENLLLAIAVYNRLFIYVGFNGMSRMRILGLFGITTVVVGFALVLLKIAQERNFQWLIRRQLWALAIASYLFLLTPHDAIVVRYNVRRILRGDPAPSVQISVHPISSEGVLALRPLLRCDDTTIREGVQALLVQRLEEAEESANERRARGWSAYQLADQRALTGLRDALGMLELPADVESAKREQALERFHEYAYQWY